MVVPKMAKNGFKSKKVDIANNSETAAGKNPSSNPKNQRIKAIFRARARTSSSFSTVVRVTSAKMYMLFL